MTNKADIENIQGPFSGSCVCGKVSYTANSLRPLWYCHCQQCRKMTGHHMAAAQADLSELEIIGEPKWYYVSEQSRHGFCPDCGSQLFWRNDTNEYLSVTGGTLEDATGLTVKGHVFTDEKGAYYHPSSSELQYPQWCKEGEI